jgi:hypothetical protein
VTAAAWALIGFGCGVILGGAGAAWLGYLWGQAQADRDHEALRAEAWKRVRGRRPTIPTPDFPMEHPAPRDPRRPYTDAEIEALMERTTEDLEP